MTNLVECDTPSVKAPSEIDKYLSEKQDQLSRLHGIYCRINHLKDRIYTPNTDNPENLKKETDNSYLQKLTDDVSKTWSVIQGIEEQLSSIETFI